MVRSRVFSGIRVTSRQTPLLYGLVVFAVFFAAMAWVQFSTPDMPDNDGFYHIKLAEVMRRQGLKPEFTWLPLSVLNAREFYDHHFLFHVGLIPFTLGDLRLGAKWAAVTFASLAFLAIWWLLRSQRVPFAEVWAIGLLAISQAFLFRMSITRAQSLSLAVLVIALYLLLSGRHRWLAPLGFVYVWLYNAFPLLLVQTVVYAAAVWLVERRIEYRPVLYAALGTGLGLLVNPYFPQDLIFIYRHYLPKLTDATATNVGNEWYPYTTLQVLENSTLTWLALGGGVLALGLSGRRIDVRTLTSLLLVGMFGLMLFQSRRFIEYFPPFVLIFAAFATAQALEGLPARRSRLYPAALALLALLGMLQMLPQAADSVKGSRSYRAFAGASAWLTANTEAGARVFQTDWDDFPRLFFYNTHNTYLIGLDPTYMQLYDPVMYDLWVDITQGKVRQLSQVIPPAFGANYVVTDLQHGSFIDAAAADPGMVEVFRDDDAIVYQIR